MKKSSKKIEADAARVDGLRPAGSDGSVSILPDGNHGDNLQEAHTFRMSIARQELIAAGLDLALSYGIDTVQSKVFIRAVNRFNLARMLNS